jgi:hypothetical protein
MSDETTTKLARIEHGAITQFNPERYRLNQAAVDYAIEEAKRIKEWPALEKAVDLKVTEQIKFVAWWTVNVSIGHAHNRGENRVPGSLPLVKAESLTGMKQQRVSDLKARLTDAEGYRKNLIGAEYIAACLENRIVRGTQGTGEFERYTPAMYTEMARTVMGSIDLDPASCRVAQKIVKATTHYTVKHDGLRQEWFGNIWLNPPYHRKLLPLFIDKLVAELAVGRAKQAIMLTNNSTDTDWFRVAIGSCQAVCFTQGRIAFLMEDGVTALNPTQGQAIFYFGRRLRRFSDEFCKTGFIVTPFGL